MNHIENITVGSLVVAPMFSECRSVWIVRGSRGYVDALEYSPVSPNRKIYEYWTFKVIDVDTSHQMVKLEVPRIAWKRLPILHWAQTLWTPIQNVELFKDILCLDCNFSCAQKCKKALKHFNA